MMRRSVAVLVSLFSLLATPARAGGVSKDIMADCLKQALLEAPSVPKSLNNGTSTAKYCSNIPGCSASMSANQCEANAVVIGACLVFQHVLSSCISAATGAPMSHTIKLNEWMGAWNKCMLCGAKDNVDDIAKISAKVGLKCGMKGLARVLGPIGVAYTVGEIGAAAIVAGGDLYASHLEKQFACDNLQKVADLKAASCGAATAARDAFSSKYCGVSFEYDYDNCGPKALKSFEATPACNDLNISCEEEPTAAALFQTAASKTLSCGIAQRMYKMYSATCNGTVCGTN